MLLHTDIVIETLPSYRRKTISPNAILLLFTDKTQIFYDVCAAV